MKKVILALFVAAMTMSSCKTVKQYDSDVLQANLVLKQKDYGDVKIYFHENEVSSGYKVVAYCTYQPLVIPLIRSERPRIEKNLLYKAVKRAHKLEADGVIIDTKNHFRVIKINR